MELKTWSDLCGMLPQDAALVQESLSLSLPGLRYKQNMHKKSLMEAA